MNIWVVEDNDADALDAAIEALRAAQSVNGLPLKSVRLFRNATVHWDTGLLAIEVKDRQPYLTDRRIRSSELVQVAPTIVILDLFDADLEFTADAFYAELREWERKHSLPRAFVVLWSIRSGKPGVQAFVSGTPIKDACVCWLNTKAPAPLKQAIEGFIRQWMENQYQ